MDETTTAAELCRVANPDMPHRRCLRVKGHMDDLPSGISRWLAPIYSWHADFAGRWKDDE